jgi:UDP-glucose 4-epimerase
MVDKKIFKKKLKALVFGGSGFLGLHLSKVLFDRGYTVTIADLKKPIFIKKGIKFIKIDILKKNRIQEIIKKNDIVYNFAAIADIQESYDNPIKTFQVNIMGSAFILKSCIEAKVKKYVLASSIYADSSQGGFYRVSKQSSELITSEFGKVHNLSYTILRFGSIYGPGSDLKNGLLKIIYDAITKKKLIYRGTDKAVRSYIHVEDAANASVDILQKKFNKKVIIIKGKKSIKIKNLLLILKKILKIKSKLIFLNRTQKGHYDKNPKPYKKHKTFNYFGKKNLELTNGLIQLIKTVKSKKI